MLQSESKRKRKRRGLDWLMDLVTTYTHDSEPQVRNYSVVADLHTLQITTANAKPHSFIVFPSRCLATAVNNGDSLASVLTQLPAG
jgi:hypothetical protein